MVQISGGAVLVTGGNRGIGRALVEEALDRGARRVYAGTRAAWSHPDPRVTRLALDVTDTGQIHRAVAAVAELDVLVNNAGIQIYEDLDDRTALERQLAVNLFGPFETVRAFLPLLARSGGAVVNNLSLAALAPVPPTPGYALSKAAAFSLTQSQRLRAAALGVTVHAVLTGPTDTDMTREFSIPKTAPDLVARALFDGVEKGEEEIFPDPLSQTAAEGWRNGVMKSLEREFARIPR